MKAAMRNLPGQNISRQNVSRETLDASLYDRLSLLAHLIAEWDQRRSLISRADATKLWERHIVDGLRLLPYITKGAAIVDIGSGNGIPGLVIAAAGHPIDLVERAEGKAAFLRFAAAEMDVAVKVHACDVQSFRGKTFDIITARAVASTSLLLTLTEHLRNPETRCLFMKGRTWQEELDVADRAFLFRAKAHVQSAPAPHLAEQAFGAGAIAERAKDQPTGLTARQLNATPHAGHTSQGHKDERSLIEIPAREMAHAQPGSEQSIGAIVELWNITARPRQIEKNHHPKPSTAHHSLPLRGQNERAQ